MLLERKGNVKNIGAAAFKFYLLLFLPRGIPIAHGRNGKT